MHNQVLKTAVGYRLAVVAEVWGSYCSTYDFFFFFFYPPADGEK